jgi:hypothetical protein
MLSRGGSSPCARNALSIWSRITCPRGCRIQRTPIRSVKASLRRRAQVLSKHNVQYLLGGHRARFFDYVDAMGVSRAHRPLEEGMVISVEATLQHPRRGFIKLEDTVAVTTDGHEIHGSSEHQGSRSVSCQVRRWRPHRDACSD